MVAFTGDQVTANNTFSIFADFSNCILDGYRFLLIFYWFPAVWKVPDNFQVLLEQRYPSHSYFINFTITRSGFLIMLNDLFELNTARLCIIGSSVELLEISSGLVTQSAQTAAD